MKYATNVLALFLLAGLINTSHAQTSADVVCAFAPSQSKAISGIATATKGVFITKGALSAAGITAVAHSSGATILTGPGGYIAGTMAAPIVGTVIVPVAIAVAGISTVVELACAPKNHPELVEKVVYGSIEYWGDSIADFEKVTGYPILSTNTAQTAASYWKEKVTDVLKTTKDYLKIF